MVVGSFVIVCDYESYVFLFKVLVDCINVKFEGFIIVNILEKNEVVIDEEDLYVVYVIFDDFMW